MRRSYSPYLLFVLIALLLSAFSQAPSAGLQGTVRDTRGVAVPWAIVEIAGHALPDGKVVHPDKSGHYTCTELPTGEYTVSVAAQGYRIVKKKHVRLYTGKLTTVDVKLKVDPYQHRKEPSEHTNCILCHPPSTPQNPKVKMD